MKRECIKYLVGLRLAERGVRGFAEAARQLGVSPAHLSNVVAGRHRTPATQVRLARLCGCTPEDLFGEYTHPSIRSPRGAGGARRQTRHTRRSAHDRNE